MQGTIYEYNPPRDQEVSKKLMNRNFEGFHVPESEVKATYEKAIDIYAGMRPKLNNMKAVFR